MNGDSSKPMYLRAQPSLRVSLEDEIMVMGRKERTGRDTVFTKPLYDLLCLAQFSLFDSPLSFPLLN